MADKEKDTPKEGDTSEKEKDASAVTAQELAAIEAQANADADAAIAAQNEKREDYPGFLPTPQKAVEKKSEYDQAVDVIKSGRGVQIGPNVYTRVEDLPPAHVMARGNIESQKRVLADLKGQRAKLDERISQVEAEVKEAEQKAKKAE